MLSGTGWRTISLKKSSPSSNLAVPQHPLIGLASGSTRTHPVSAMAEETNRLPLLVFVGQPRHWQLNSRSIWLRSRVYALPSLL